MLILHEVTDVSSRRAARDGGGSILPHKVKVERMFS